MNENRLISRVRKIVENNPEYVYRDDHDDCFYTDNETKSGSCIIGRAILEEKPDLYDYLHFIDKSSKYGIEVEHEILRNLLKKEFYCSNQHIKWLSFVQSAQDDGASWEESIKVADTSYIVNNV